MAEEVARLLGGRYRLLSPMRRGDTGIVWRAHDSRLRRDVAIKEVHAGLQSNELDLARARRRALREARAAGRLSHSSIITVHDLLEERGRLWIVMELLEALTLQETVKHVGALPAHWTAWIGFQLLSGLRHAHSEGVLHRDINPGNILLTGDRVVLADFGIAALNGDASYSSGIPMNCTPAYTAPERLRGGPVSPAADLWSFAACLYFAVEGRPPYTGPDAVAVIAQAMTTDPPSPKKAGPLRPVIESLLHPDPARRLTGDHAALLFTEILRHEGIPMAPYRLPAVKLPPDAFTK
ncbi:Serine/threonine protein kinase [Thermostaphylospora chromogena]|uniref:non-specific serine/threonine protein kinase n=2 Tax=Thermostaphylospora chromogena TaxID=35622 RepID=A0A1H1HI28_9ACTN|nr:Serine/threonine protein kinase [Thermostaphylospora chromogena]